MVGGRVVVVDDVVVGGRVVVVDDDVEPCESLPGGP